MMEPTFATRWFYSSVEGGRVEAGFRMCAVCGLPMAVGVPVRDVLRKTFTDQAALRAPGCDQACEACAWYFDHQELRRSSWWLTAGEARPLAKGDVGPLLQEHLGRAPVVDGYYLITIMKRKHLALWAPLNLARSATLRVRFEVTTVELNYLWLTLVEAAHRLREFHSWREIQNDDYNAKFLMRWSDPLEFVRLRQVVQPWLRTPYLDLTQYVWTKEEKKQVW